MYKYQEIYNSIMAELEEDKSNEFYELRKRIYQKIFKYKSLWKNKEVISELMFIDIDIDKIDDLLIDDIHAIEQVMTANMMEHENIHAIQGDELGKFKIVMFKVLLEKCKISIFK